MKSTDDLDKSTDPRFFEYYAEQSDSEEAIARFERLAEAVLAQLPADQSGKSLEIADIGGGAGTLSRILARKGHRPTCIDLSSDLLEEGRRRAVAESLDVAFENCSATDLPFPDSSFDLCFLPELLEHVEDWRGCLDEAARVLRPGGALYISTTNALCPHQSEFNLPFYSWYPGKLKRYFEHRAKTDQPELANFAKYPAVNWFTVYSLMKYLRGRGFDRFLTRADLMAAGDKSRAKSLVVKVISALPPLQFALQFATPGSIVVGFKSPD